MDKETDGQREEKKQRDEWLEREIHAKTHKRKTP